MASPPKRPVLNERRVACLKTAIRILRSGVGPQTTTDQLEVAVAVAFLEATVGITTEPEAPHTGDRRNGV